MLNYPYFYVLGINNFIDFIDFIILLKTILFNYKNDINVERKKILYIFIKY